MQPAIVMGIMSGTSLDGADFALCAISGARFELLAAWRAAFPRVLQARLHAAASGAATAWELAQVHHDLGRFYAAHARPSSRRPRAQLAGLHGQTIFHNPHRPAPATLQLGEPAYLVEKLRVPVVSNFRAADIAAGGQGAPLATVFHVRVFGRRGRHVCVNNLGGISNVTSIDWRRGKDPEVLSFDTGPANVLIDMAMRHFTEGRLTFDREGRWAARGRVREEWVRRWMGHPFFRKAPPKSTGRELFGESFFKKALALAGRRKFSKFDLIRTFTEFTARSIVESYRRHLKSRPQSVVLSGGGAANPVLVEAIRNCLRVLDPCIEMVTSVEQGWPLQSVEPAAFAYLAWLRVRGRPGNLPETTGARAGVLCGQLSG